MDREPVRRLRLLVFPTDRSDVAYLRSVPWYESGNLDTLEGLIGGLPEALDLTDDARMYLDVVGKRKGRPANAAANRLVYLINPGFSSPNDYIAGQVIVTGSLDADGEDDGDEHDVPDDVVELCRRAGLQVIDETSQ